MNALQATVIAIRLAFGPPVLDDVRPIDREAAEPQLEIPPSWPEQAPTTMDPGHAAAGEHDGGTVTAPPPTLGRPPKTQSDGLEPVGPRPPADCWKTRSQCRQLSITGIVFGTLGLAAMGTGIGLILQPDQPIADEPAYARSTRPPGIVATGMGIGVLVTGMLMIIAGQRAWRMGLDRSLAQRTTP